MNFLGIFFIIILIFIPNKDLFANTDARNIILQKVSDDKGNSIVSATALYQDKTGYMFIGTEDGLYIYDGYNFIVHKHDLKNPNSISGNWITDIFHDSENKLWIGTKDGLNLFQRETNQFESFKLQEPNSSSTQNNYIKSISEDSKGQLWIGARTGIFKFDKERKIFESIPDLNEEKQFEDYLILQSYVSTDDKIWAVSESGGITVYNPEDHSFKNYRTREYNLPSNFITSITQDDLGNIWVSFNTPTWGDHESLTGGLCKLDPKTDKVTVFNSILTPDKYPIDDLEIYKLYKDPKGYIWIGFVSGSLMRLDPKTEVASIIIESDTNANNALSMFIDQTGLFWFGRKFLELTKFSVNKKLFSRWTTSSEYCELSDDHITAIHEDHKGNILIGTLNNGFNKYNIKTEQWSHFTHDPNDPNSLPGTRVSEIYEDSHGNLWIGVYPVGLILFDPIKGKTIKHYKGDANATPYTITDDRIRDIYEDTDGFLWIGGRSGLSKYDYENKTFTHYRHDPNKPESLAHKRVMMIFEDSKKRFWIATEGGLDLMDRETGTFTHYKNDKDDTHSLSYDQTRCIAEDSDGNIWIGTRDGLNMFNEKEENFLHYRTEHGLPSNVIYGILEDKNKNLWVSTYHGLARMNLHSGELLTYDKDMGLCNMFFELNAYLQTRSGTLYFGGTKGVDFFKPELLESKNILPRLSITQIKVFGKAVRKLNIENNDEIELSFKDNHISFEFSTLDYLNPIRNHYAYKMEGVDNDWIHSGTRHYANYTNLSPGRYKFIVHGANSMNIWNRKGTTLNITIKPLIRQTLWFKSLLSFLILLSIFGIHQLVTRSIRKKNLELKLANNKLNNEVGERKTVEAQLLEAKEATETANISLENAANRAVKLAEKAKDASKAKSAFLANMSHEIRTPMNGVLGMISLLLESNLSEDQRHNAEVAHSSANGLLGLIDDILDLSKIEAGMLSMERIDFDLRSTITDACNIFEFRAQSKKLRLIQDIDENIPKILKGDPNRLRQIIVNLGSNAVKFTNEGSITIKAKVYKETLKTILLRFEVIDTGIGIPDDKIKQVFHPFSQMDSTTTRKYGGTGLGLAISNQLIELMNGDIGAHSKEGSGSTFWFTAEFEKSNKAQIKSNKSSLNKHASNEVLHKNILVVEDNLINQKVVSKMLKKFECEVTCASGGKLALKLLESNKYDLILMDCQMPDMDGYEVTRRIRESGEFKNLPIIALTAHAMKGDKEKCLEAGMDDYITKPITFAKLNFALSIKINESKRADSRQLN